MKSSILLFAALLFVGLTSCNKDGDTKPTSGLTGKAKQVNDLVYDKIISSGTKSIIINKEVDYSETGGISHNFTVDKATAYTTDKPGEQPGQGVKYVDSAGVYEVTAVMLNEFPEIITVAIYLNNKLEGSIAYHY